MSLPVATRHELELHERWAGSKASSSSGAKISVASWSWSGRVKSIFSFMSARLSALSVSGQRFSPDISDILSISGTG